MANQKSDKLWHFVLLHIFFSTVTGENVFRPGGQDREESALCSSAHPSQGIRECADRALSLFYRIRSRNSWILGHELPFLWIIRGKWAERSLLLYKSLQPSSPSVPARSLVMDQLEALLFPPLLFLLQWVEHRRCPAVSFSLHPHGLCEFHVNSL